MAKHSAGIVLVRVVDGTPEFLLVHPGGPWWKNKDQGAWSIPKGEYGVGDDPFQTAAREFAEELGAPLPAAAPLALGSITQAGGKVVQAWCVVGEIDPSIAASNTFEMEWPPRSGRMQNFPEVDRAEFFALEVAETKIVAGQRPLLRRESMLCRNNAPSRQTKVIDSAVDSAVTFAPCVPEQLPRSWVDDVDSAAQLCPPHKLGVSSTPRSPHGWTDLHRRCRRTCCIAGQLSHLWIRGSALRGVAYLLSNGARAVFGPSIVGGGRDQRGRASRDQRLGSGHSSSDRRAPSTGRPTAVGYRSSRSMDDAQRRFIEWTPLHRPSGSGWLRRRLAVRLLISARAGRLGRLPRNVVAFRRVVEDEVAPADA